MPPKTKKDSIYEQYFSITNENIEKYGKILFYFIKSALFLKCMEFKIKEAMY